MKSSAPRATPAPLRGSALKKGDTLGVLAPSSPLEPQRLARGVEHLRSLGYQVTVALDPSAHYGKTDYLFSSDSAVRRASALHGLFSDPTIKAIVSARGGYGTMEILPLLDFELIRRNPKPLIGFSDTTVLLNALYGRAGLAAVHGPSVDSCARAGENENIKASIGRLLGMLEGESQTFTGTVLRAAEPAEGPLVGGNLALVNALLSTPWEIDLAGKILFLEEIGEKPYRVHRFLLQLKLGGKFDSLRGVVLGNFNDCAHGSGLGPSLDQVFSDIFADATFPVLSGVPFGHGEPNFPMPIGCRARITGEKLELIETPVLI